MVVIVVIGVVCGYGDRFCGLGKLGGVDLGYGEGFCAGSEGEKCRILMEGGANVRMPSTGSSF